VVDKPETKIDKPAVNKPVTRTPVWLSIVMAACFIEAAALVAGAILMILALVMGRTSDVGMAIFVLIFAGGMGAILVWTSLKLRHGKRWTRGPIVTWQLFQLAVALPLLQGSTPWIGILLLLFSALILIGLFTPRVVKATTDPSGPSAMV